MERILSKIKPSDIYEMMTNGISVTQFGMPVRAAHLLAIGLIV